MAGKYSIAEARNKLSSLVHAVEHGSPVELTRRGRPVAVLMSITDFSRLSEPKPDLWSAIQCFRRETDLADLDIDDVLKDVRDRCS